jgi:hypothetical protein
MECKWRVNGGSVFAGLVENDAEQQNGTAEM